MTEDKMVVVDIVRHKVMLDSLQHHGLQHIRLPCSSPSPGACSNSCPLSLPSNHLILCHLFSCLQILPSIRVFSNESAHHIRWPKYWSFSFSVSPSSDYSGLVSFRMDWFDLLEVQGIWDCYLTTKSFILLSFKRVINIYTYIYISEDFCPAYKREPHM